MTWYWPRMLIFAVGGKSFSAINRVDLAFDVRNHTAQVATIDVGRDVEHALHRVVRNRLVARLRLDRGDSWTNGSPARPVVASRRATADVSSTEADPVVIGVAIKSSTEAMRSIGVCTATV